MPLNLYSQELTKTESAPIVPVETVVTESTSQSVTPATNITEKTNGASGNFLSTLRVGYNLGVNMFNGDIASYNLFPKKGYRKDAFRKGYNLYVQSDINEKINVGISFGQGGLKGKREEYAAPNTFSSFLCQYMEFNASFGITNKLFSKTPKLFFRKSQKDILFWEIHAGVGVVAFRSLTWTLHTGKVDNYYGYNMTDDTIIGHQMLGLKKSGMKYVVQIPVGFVFGVKLNTKTNFYFKYDLHYTFTDKLDANKVGDFANDRFSFFGFGISSKIISESKDDNIPAKNVLDNGKGFFIGANVGLSLPDGDGSLYNVFPTTQEYTRSFKPNYNVFVQKNFTKYVGARIIFQNGNLKGSHIQPPQQTIDFKSNYWSVSATAVYKISKFLFYKKFNDIVDVNLIAGAGMISFRSYNYIKATQSVQDAYGFTKPDSITVTNKITEYKKGKALNKLVVPVGLDFSFKLNSIAALNVQYLLNMTNAEELDATIRRYSKFDRISFFGIGVTTLIGKKTSKPKAAFMPEVL
jgi:hypothetical protein